MRTSYEVTWTPSSTVSLRSLEGMVFQQAAFVPPLARFHIRTDELVSLSPTFLALKPTLFAPSRYSGR